MNEHELATLMDRAGAELLPDVPDLVGRGQARGRTRLRRRRISAAVVAAAVVGVMGTSAYAAQLHTGAGHPRGLEVAGRSTGPAKPTPPSSHPVAPAPDMPLALDPAGIRQQVAAMLPPGELGPILDDETFPVVNAERDRIVHFRYRGTLTSFIIEPARGMGSCQEQGGPDCTVVDGLEVLAWGPDTADGVTAQGISVWKHGYIVSVLSYNAADGKDVVPALSAPAISLETLTAIAMSDAWYA